MSISKIISLSLKGLSKNKIRTFLMMLGIIIGIATLTVIVSLGKGAEQKISKEIQKFGPNAIMIQAGGGKLVGPPDEKTTTLTIDDARTIKETIKGIKYIAPYIQKQGQNVIYGDKNTTTAIMGVTTEWQDAWDWPAIQGDFISEEDVAGMTKNCVLGHTVVTELFGGQNPTGETIRIGNVIFKVTGILKTRGAGPMGSDMDNRILVPLSTS